MQCLSPKPKEYYTFNNKFKKYTKLSYTKVNVFKKTNFIHRIWVISLLVLKVKKDNKFYSRGIKNGCFKVKYKCYKMYM